MANTRLYFAVQTVAFYKGSEWDRLEASAIQADGSRDYSAATPALPFIAHGVQDVNMTSNFQTTPVFEFGQASTYENTEGIPTVEITASKLIDGKPPLWCLATLDAITPTLQGRSNAYSTVQLGMWPDTESRCFYNGTGSYDANDNPDGLGTADPATTGNDYNADSGHLGLSVLPISVITCPKCYPSSISYTITTTDNATESITLSGSEKLWARAKQSQKLLPGGLQANVIADDVRFNTIYADFQDNDDTPDIMIARGHNVMLRPLIADPELHVDQNGAVNDPDCSVFPIEIPGISAIGTSDVSTMLFEAEGAYQADPNYASIQSITISSNFAREDEMTLGWKLPVNKRMPPVVQVTSEITTTAKTDDGIQVAAFTETCRNTAATANQTIRIAICNGDEPAGEESDSNGMRIYLGTKNRLQSIAIGGGATNSNATHTYSYSTNNDLTVVAKSDPNERGEEWWTNRRNWVCGADIVVTP